MSKFKVGQKVWSLMYGWGTILQIRKEEEDYRFPIVVGFGDGAKTYNMEGFAHVIRKIPDLYTQEMELVPKPLPLPPKGTPILVRHGESKNWFLRIFQRPAGKKIIASSNVTEEGYVTEGIPWDYWKPYEVPHGSN